MASHLSFTTKHLTDKELVELLTRMGVEPGFHYTYSHDYGGTLLKEGPKQTIIERGIFTGDPVQQYITLDEFGKPIAGHPANIPIAERQMHIEKVTQQAVLLQEHGMKLPTSSA